MTGPQANWLKINKRFEAVGRGCKYIERGVLDVHGQYTALGARGGRPAQITAGMIEVGVRDRSPHGPNR